MKRSKKLICLIAVLAILIGAAYAIPALLPEESQEEEDSGFTLLTLDAETVTAISWTYEEQTITLTNSDGVWAYADDSAFPLDTSFVDAMLDTLSEVTAYKTIEEPEELVEYGLLRPVCTIHVTGEQEYEILLGDETSMGGERYLSIGDGKVYLAEESIVDSFCYGLYDIVKPEPIPSMTDVESLTASSAVQKLELCRLENSGIAYTDSYVWFEKTDSGYRVLDTELTKDLISVVTGLSWNACVDYKAGDHLSDYGLDTPRVSVTVGYGKTVQVETNETDEDGNAIYETQTEDAVFTLEIGTDTSDGSYARMGGSNMVYLIDSDIAETLLYTTVSELQPDEVILLDWDEVTALDIMLDGETYHIEKTVQEVTDDEGNTTEETVYLVGGEQITIEAVLEELSGMESTGYTGGIAPERTAEIGFVFYREHETYPRVELTFYQYDSSSCLTVLNGGSTLFVERSDVLNLAEAINKLVL